MPPQAKQQLKGREGEEHLVLALLVEKMRLERGWDFHGYKRSSLGRRVAKRVAACGVGSVEDYMKYLDADPSEYARLFSSVTIKVSEFFRDSCVFDAASAALASPSTSDGALRVWCCAAARGEEAYSIAMLAAEKYGKAAHERVRIYATDIDHEAIEAAREGLYRPESLRNVPEPLKARYFSAVGGNYKVSNDLRGLVKFGRLDIVRDHPLPRIDLLFCRNLFIYFDKGQQERAFTKLDASVRAGGLLAMGQAEKVPFSFAARYDRLHGTASAYVKRSVS